MSFFSFFLVRQLQKTTTANKATEAKDTQTKQVIELELTRSIKGQNRMKR